MAPASAVFWPHRGLCPPSLCDGQTGQCGAFVGSLLRGPRGCSTPFCCSGIAGADTAEGAAPVRLLGCSWPSGWVVGQGRCKSCTEPVFPRTPVRDRSAASRVSALCSLAWAQGEGAARSLPWWARLPRGTSLSGPERTTCPAAGPGSRAEQTPLHPQFIPRPRCEPWTLKHCGKASGRGLGPSARAASRPTPRGAYRLTKAAPKASAHWQGGLLRGL